MDALGVPLDALPVVVEVRNRFDGSWSHGFEVMETAGDDVSGPKFRLRRLSDGYVLPEWFAADDIVACRP
jgi:hypothetical protein